MGLGREATCGRGVNLIEIRAAARDELFSTLHPLDGRASLSRAGAVSSTARLRPQQGAEARGVFFGVS